MRTVLDALVAVSFFGLPGLLVGFLVGLGFQLTRRFEIALSASAAALACVLIVAAYARADEPWVMLTFVVTNLIGCVAGLFTGSTFRRERSR